MALPIDFNTIILTGKFVDFAGTAMAGTINFSPGTVVKSPGTDTIVYPKVLSATLNGSGAFTIVLPRTNDPDIIPEFIYTVSENFTGQSVRTYQIELGTEYGPTVDLADIAPIADGSFAIQSEHVHSNPLRVGLFRIWFGPVDPEDNALPDDYWIRPLEG